MLYVTIFLVKLNFQVIKVIVKLSLKIVKAIAKYIRREYFFKYKTFDVFL